MSAIPNRKPSRQPAPAPMVRVRGVKKVYPGGVEALSGIDLDFPEGQLTSLLGPSGCGKTTLLKIIAGLLPATAGTVEVDGRPVTEPGPERAFVFQDFALMPWATVMRNVGFRSGTARCWERGTRNDRGEDTSSLWDSRASRQPIRTRFRAACGNGLASRGRSPSTPRCC